MKNFYVYQYCDPVTELPFYIGKGKNGRYLDHIKMVKRKSINSVCVQKCRAIISAGQFPLINIIFENLTENDAHEKEKELIAKYGRMGMDINGILLNKSRGGKSNTGYKHSIETKEKLSKIRTGNTHHSKETRELISKRTSEALLANPEARKKISDTHKGKSLSPEHKKKVTDHLARMRSDPSFYDRVLQSRIDNNNLNHSEETKEKISTRTIEAMKNPDIIKRMKDSSKKRWSNPEERAKIALKNSKSFILTHKITGETFSITNLAQYCRDNKTHHRKVHLEFSVISSVHSVQ